VEEKIKSFKLTIRPAILPEQRHLIEDALKKMGFTTWAGGTHTDMSECDIAFEKR